MQQSEEVYNLTTQLRNEAVEAGEIDHQAGAEEVKSDEKAKASGEESVSLETQRVCRICYGGGPERLLTRVCGCKGSLSYVHESCLLRWLDNSNTSVLSSSRRCEICHKDYRISYEFESVSNIVKNAFSYAFADQKRLLRGCIYGLYLWVFFRRFI